MNMDCFEKLEDFKRESRADGTEILPVKYEGFEVYMPVYYDHRPHGIEKFFYIKGNDVKVWTLDEALSYGEKRRREKLREADGGK